MDSEGSVLPVSPPTMPISAPAVAYCVVALMVSTIALTYATCVEEGHRQCPHLPHLPTISMTWEDVPGNFVSRAVVSIVAWVLASLHFVLWGPLQGQTIRVCKWEVPVIALKWLGVVGAVCFSGVGAVCDADHDPMCEGDNTIHSIMAVVFLVTQSAESVMLTHVTGHKRLALVIAVASVLLKLRWLPPSISPLCVVHALRTQPSATEDQTILAIFEWADVALILGFIAWFVPKHRQAYGFRLTAAGDAGNAARPTTATDDNAPPLFSLSARTISLAVLGLLLLNLGICTPIYFAKGHVPHGTWPLMGELWTIKPNNWIARWSLMLMALSASLGHALLNTLEKGNHRLWHALALVSLVGLGASGCIGANENHELHYLCSAVFLVGYDAYMLGKTISTLISRLCGGMLACVRGQRQRPTGLCSLLVALLVAVSASGLTALLLTTLLLRTAAPPTWLPLWCREIVSEIDSRPLWLPVLEWLNVALVGAFFVASILLHGGAAATAALTAGLLSAGDTTRARSRPRPPAEVANPKGGRVAALRVGPVSQKGPAARLLLDYV